MSDGLRLKWKRSEQGGWYANCACGKEYGTRVDSVRRSLEAAHAWTERCTKVIEPYDVRVVASDRHYEFHSVSIREDDGIFMFTFDEKKLGLAEMKRHVADRLDATAANLRREAHE